MTDQTSQPLTEEQLASTIYDSICAFQLTAQYASLQHAQMRQYLAEHLAAALSATPAALPDGFERQSCVTVKCAACGYVHDEAEYTHHFPGLGDALDEVVGAGWDELKDGRVLCEAQDEKHEAMRAEIGLAEDDDEEQPAAEGAQQTATLLVDRTSSSCGACGQPTLPRALAHVDVSGYAPKRGGGCGATFTAIRSVNRGVGAEDLLTLRPDLPIAP